MKQIFFLLVFQIYLSAYAQKSTIYILDSLSQNEMSSLNKLSEKNNIEFKTGEPDDLITKNYGVILALEKANKNWFVQLDKDLQESTTWKKVKKTNTEVRETTGEYYEYISFWEFGLVKKYQHHFIGKVGSRGEAIKRESNYTREGLLKK